MREIVNQELGFAEAVATPKHTAFLCIVNKRVVGMVLAEGIETAFLLLSSSEAEIVAAAASAGKCCSDELGMTLRRTIPSNSSTMAFGMERSKESRKASLGIYQIWVHSNYRNRGIARSLVDAARTHLYFGLIVPVDQLAFSSPTESGVKFARRYNSRQRGHEKRNSSQSPSDHHLNEDNEVLVYDCLR